MTPAPDASLLRFNPEGLPAPRGYSHVALTRGALAFIAGQTPTDANGRTVGRGDFEIQARQAFANLDIALAAVGAGFESVAALTVYCVSSVVQDELWSLSAAVGARVGDGEAPAMTLLFISRLLDLIG